MTNPNNIVQGKHLESLASDTRSYILAKDLEVIQAVQADLDEVQADLDNLAAQTAGAISKINSVPTVASGDENKFLRGDGTWANPQIPQIFTLGTTPSTVEGAMWLED